jgi:hypothetical protein
VTGWSVVIGSLIMTIVIWVLSVLWVIQPEKHGYFKSIAQLLWYP